MVKTNRNLVVLNVITLTPPIGRSNGFTWSKTKRILVLSELVVWEKYKNQFYLEQNLADSRTVDRDRRRRSGRDTTPVWSRAGQPK